MDLNELIESTLRSQHLEEMQNRPREEYSPIKGMSSEQIERYACFLYKELQVRTQELERMNVRLDEIMDELKKSGKKIDNLTGLLEKANDRADKALLESKMHQKENIELKKMNATPPTASEPDEQHGIRSVQEPERHRKEEACKRKT